MRTRKRLRSLSTRFGLGLATLVLASLVTACSDDDDEDSPIEISDTPAVEASTDAPPDSDDTVPSDDALTTPAVMNVPGLDVAGLGDESPDLLFSDWFLYMESFVFPEAPGDAGVYLNAYTEPSTATEEIEFFTTPLDACVIVDIGGNGEDGEPVNDNANSRWVDGGEELVINLPGGPWASIPRRPIATGEVIYTVVDELPGSIPGSASLVVPGAEFPTVDDYPLLTPSSVPQRLAPASGVFDPTATVFEWVPDGDTNVLLVDFLAFDEGGGFIGFPVYCPLENDGSFELPAEVAEYLADTGHAITSRFVNVRRTLSFSNGIALFQQHEIAESNEAWDLPATLPTAAVTARRGSIGS